MQVRINSVLPVYSGPLIPVYTLNRRIVYNKFQGHSFSSLSSGGN